MQSEFEGGHARMHDNHDEPSEVDGNLDGQAKPKAGLNRVETK